MLASDSGLSGLVIPSTRSPGTSVVTRAPTATTSPAASRPSCIGMGKARRPWIPPSSGFAVELVDLAGAVLDVPARDGCGEHFDENVGWPDLRDRIVAVDEFFRPAKLEQTDRFHRVHQSPMLARLPNQRMNRLKSAFLARSPICLST